MKIILENKDVNWIHEYLKELLDFPDYYGNNLDALYDCLCDMEANIELEIREQDPYLDKIVHVFEDASKENASLHVKISR